MRTTKGSAPSRRPAVVVLLLGAALIFSALAVTIHAWYVIRDLFSLCVFDGGFGIDRLYFRPIASMFSDKCYNRSLCEEYLNLILPAKPPFHPRQFKTCAVVGNSGDLLKTEFGEEIDEHDAVFRDNEAPVNEVVG
ncbi:hypothetical protein BHE74_00047347 [Ensete ventricosum]|uniref:Uncharacterized protein n=1 Tax=Ensete ventricosum TaxID=4639 RepID=A0A427AA47_ENSVE|nr:hypothetical protein B296_00006539 [Ensete ventricosum]RWW21710.1 hypothetical protein GW17_00014119 [Ensete ventricosum]RWW46707.1 hypothetical protein BHE74_00047347 [Ensete ventricosum]RZR85819.1 hypothetical protein BHM03_00012876 [Ensete ventricosum]